MAKYILYYYFIFISTRYIVRNVQHLSYNNVISHKYKKKQNLRTILVLLFFPTRLFYYSYINVLYKVTKKTYSSFHSFFFLLLFCYKWILASIEKQIFKILYRNSRKKFKQLIKWYNKTHFFITYRLVYIYSSFNIRLTNVIVVVIVKPFARVEFQW